jgi:small redox-active disulfide protein 2
MKIMILGTGCAGCRKLEENVKKAVAALGLRASVEKVSDLAKIVEMGVMSVPALVIDGEVVLSGQSPSIAEIKEILGEMV